MINKVILSGRLTKDPEAKKTSNNLSVCSFTLAVNRKYKSDNGPEADFINCIAWRQSADYLSSYAHKGDMIELEGSIQVRNYQNQEGKKVYITEVMAESVSIVSSKKVEEKKEEPKQETESNYIDITDQFVEKPKQGVETFSPLDFSQEELEFY